MQITDINCDMGEATGNDELIMPYITSANIACGYHAGDINEMYKTVQSAVKNNVKIGAHVSFLDKENFGRTPLNLSADEVYEIVEQQLLLLKEVTDLFDVPLHHVKPHGALYNQSAANQELAKAIARAVRDFDHRLVLYGLSGSHSIREAKLMDLSTASEVFADRNYEDDGSLTPRSSANAMLEDPNVIVRRVMQIVQQGTLTSVNGLEIAMEAQTICLHGDTKNAVHLAKAIHAAIRH
jgi:UPF0271 protein